VLSDVHSPEEALEAASILDLLQIPAFLCRQTDLLLGRWQDGKADKREEGTVPGPLGYEERGGKIESTGNFAILLTERGTSFGYNNLVVDFRSLPIMADLAIR